MERIIWRGLIVVGLYTVISLLVDKYCDKKVNSGW